MMRSQNTRAAIETFMVSSEARKAYAKTGIALPDGSYPIPDKAHLNYAIVLRRASNRSYATVVAHIRKRAAALGIKVDAARLASGSVQMSPLEEFVRTQSARQAKRRRSPLSIRGRDPSLRWPHLYDILRAKGHSKEAAAKISNSHLRYRRKGRLEGLPWQKANDAGELAKLRAKRRK